MGSIIIALPKPEDGQKISTGLSKSGLSPDVVCTTAAEVLNEVHRRDNGVVICSSRLRDMNYRELAEYLPDYFEMLLLSSGLVIDECPPGMVRMAIPFRMSELVSSVEMMLEQQDRRIRKLRHLPKKRNEEDEADISKAKLLLMNRNRMTEPEAYRYIQKCSMDSGTNMVETAQMILLLNSDR